MEIETLKEAIKDWSDEHYSMHAVAIALGIMGPEKDANNYPPHAKHVFWTVNPVGDFLQNVLQQLTAIGVLETCEMNNDDCYRWNSSFKGSWEQ